MQYELTDHAKEEAARRGIPLAVIHEVVIQPDQIVEERRGRRAHQSKVAFAGGKIMLVRVIVDPATDPWLVVTVYRTSKVAKYWR